MLTVKDVIEAKQKQSEVSSKEVDSFIEEVLIPRFCNSSVNSIILSESEIQKCRCFVGKSNELIKQVLQGRGFSVKYICEDRPCAITYYNIGIPPQRR